MPGVKLSHRPPVSQLDRPPQGHTVALSAARPGEQPAVLTCPASHGPVCSLSKIFLELSISIGRSQVYSGGWGVGELPGEVVCRVGREKDPAATWPPAGKQVLSEPRLSVSYQCSLGKEVMPEAEPAVSVLICCPQ